MVENLINDLMDLAKMDNHQFSLNLDYFDLTKTISQAFSILKDSAQVNGISLIAEIT